MHVLGFTFTGFSDLVGGLLYFIYNSIQLTINNETVHSYGLAIIILTVIIKLILMPLNIKSIRANIKMQELQPELKAIQDRYKNDKEKLNQELMKFYQEKKFNPAGGCLPMLLQMPVLILLYKVFSSPLSHMLGAAAFIPKIQTTIFGAAESVTESMIIKGFTPEISQKLLAQNAIPADLGAKILEMKNGMYFWGMNLTDIPSYNTTDLFGPQAFDYWILMLIPILSFVTMYLSSKLSMATSGSDDNPQAQMAKKMLWLGPIMPLIFAFQFPAALGLYWIASNVFQIFQQLYVNKYIKVDNTKEVALKK